MSSAKSSRECFVIIKHLGPRKGQQTEISYGPYTRAAAVQLEAMYLTDHQDWHRRHPKRAPLCIITVERKPIEI